MLGYQLIPLINFARPRVTFLVLTKACLIKLDNIIGTNFDHVQLILFCADQYSQLCYQQ